MYEYDGARFCLYTIYQRVLTARNPGINRSGKCEIRRRTFVRMRGADT